jgi:hypothetical protein
MGDCLRRTVKGTAVTVALWLGSLLAACVQVDTPIEEPKPQSVTTPIHFSYLDHAGREVSPKTTRGRVTIVALVTTYDLASQMNLRRVNQALGSYSPRINAFALVLEPPSYRVLVDSFAKSLDLHLPLVMADQASLDGGGPFGPIDYVPTLVFLDRQGRMVERLRGPLSAEQIREALGRANRFH